MSKRSRVESTKIILYALQTCSHCKDLKRWLAERGLPFQTVNVDMLAGAERNDTLRHLRRINPRMSFPTLVVGDTTIVGFKEEDIRTALAIFESE